MKTLSNYVEEGQTKAFDKAGAFFAFGDKQLEEQKKEGVKYLSMGMGLVCPADNCKELAATLKSVHIAGMKQDMEENGKENIIKRELSNHEAYYTYEIEDTVDALKCYGITAEEIRVVFNKEKVLCEDY